MSVSVCLCLSVSVSVCVCLGLCICVCIIYIYIFIDRNRLSIRVIINNNIEVSRYIYVLAAILRLRKIDLLGLGFKMLGFVKLLVRVSSRSLGQTMP